MANKTKSVQRTCAVLREQEIRYEIREKWNQYSRKRQDGHGFIDVEALYLDRKQIVGIQCCGTDIQPHIRKMQGTCAAAAKDWLKCGGGIEIWAWRRLKKKRGGKAFRWDCKIIPITLQDFPKSL